MSLKTPHAASASRQSASSGEGHRASVISVLPQITMPPREDWIRFWKARGGAGANQDATMSQRLDRLRTRIEEIELAFQGVIRRCKTADASDPTNHLMQIRAEHAALTELQQLLAQLDSRLDHFLSELDDSAPTFLAVWRVTEKQILATDARALKEGSLSALMQRLKRHQVELAGQIIDLG